MTTSGYFGFWMLPARICVPMPLLSYGGTVMLTVMVGFGLVQAVRVHRYSEITSGAGAVL